MGGVSDTNPKHVGVEVSSPKPGKSLEVSRASPDYYNSPRIDIVDNARAVGTDKNYKMNKMYRMKIDA